jgi:hypothetical protein
MIAKFLKQFSGNYALVLPGEMFLKNFVPGKRLIIVLIDGLLKDYGKIFFYVTRRN